MYLFVFFVIEITTQGSSDETELLISKLVGYCFSENLILWALRSVPTQHVLCQGASRPSEICSVIFL